MPYSTGEQYEGSAHLIGLLQKRALEERQEMVNELMKQGKQAEAMNIPPLLHSFTMLFFSPDSKLMAYMESKRQLIPLHRYLERYPDANPRVFPPHRKAYVSANQRPGDWTVLVRRIMPPLHSPSPAVAHLPQARPSLNAQPRHYSDVSSERLSKLQGEAYDISPQPSLMHLGYQERSKP